MYICKDFVQTFDHNFYFMNLFKHVGLYYRLYKMRIYNKEKTQHQSNKEKFNLI